MKTLFTGCAVFITVCYAVGFAFRLGIWKHPMKRSMKVMLTAVTVSGICLAAEQYVFSLPLIIVHVLAALVGLAAVIVWFRDWQKARTNARPVSS